jgi:hypothetical protein
MEVIVKKGKEKHPDHPSRDPLRKKMEEQGEHRLKAGKLKFDNEGDKKDYERRVAANPHNVMGFPAYYPPQTIAPSHGIGEGKPAEVLPCGHRWVIMRILPSGEKRYGCHYGGDFPAEALQPGFQSVVEWTCRHPIHHQKEGQS